MSIRIVIDPWLAFVFVDDVDVAGAEKTKDGGKKVPDGSNCWAMIDLNVTSPDHTSDMESGGLPGLILWSMRDAMPQ